MISSVNGPVEPEKYEAVKIPINRIKLLASRGLWETSIEKEEVDYNIAHGFYEENYVKAVKEALQVTRTTETCVIISTFIAMWKMIGSLLSFATKKLT